MTNTTQTDLLDGVEPCPFCGHKPDMKDPDTCYPTGNYWRYDPEVECQVYVTRADMQEGDGQVYCLNCSGTSGGCGVQMLGDSKEDVIAKWNNRKYIEALLIANRKQVLLEAAEDRELLIKLVTIIDRFTNERWHSAFARDWADCAASDYAKQFEKLLPELRRMALEPAGVDKGEK